MVGGIGWFITGRQFAAVGGLQALSACTHTLPPTLPKVMVTVVPSGASTFRVAPIPLIMDPGGAVQI